ncbi:hypothetical protein TNIN_94061 [Trichonephila inaurata madagascariensis]|uniref:Uncharacterized protein n=1 Tax=Trichonephila inaurata madagascariensis TaxID=2747483 RepID=A0A8X6MA27_9ARAC|nr:hypothetical protein TNIN_94061 [Trichonephila inaurata madagascariensis]
MSFLTKGRKVDLINLDIELNETVPPDSKVIDFRKIITGSENHEEGADKLDAYENLREGTKMRPSLANGGMTLRSDSRNSVNREFVPRMNRQYNIEKCAEFGFHLARNCPKQKIIPVREKCKAEGHTKKHCKVNMWCSDAIPFAQLENEHQNKRTKPKTVFTVPNREDILRNKKNFERRKCSTCVIESSDGTI